MLRAGDKDDAPLAEPHNAQQPAASGARPAAPLAPQVGRDTEAGSNSRASRSSSRGSGGAPSDAELQEALEAAEGWGHSVCCAG